jgi:hypothetical protein
MQNIVLFAILHQKYAEGNNRVSDYGVKLAVSEVIWPHAHI